jgi:hypothetical protein
VSPEPDALEQTPVSDHLERDVRFLKRYALGTTILLGLVSVAAFTRQGTKTKFDEIDVERINIVERNGNLRLVLSNSDRSPPPIYKGRPFGYAGGGRPGMIFFNDEGSENGGLTFTGRRLPNGTVTSSGHLSFDQFDQDQVLVLNYTDRPDSSRTVGVQILDRANVSIYDWVQRRDSIDKMPDGPAKIAARQKWAEPIPGVPLAAERVWMGRDRSKNAVVNLSDKLGKPRLRLIVDSLGSARVEFLNSDGRVTYSLPDSGRRGGGGR